jgi:hypothetical protein
LKQKGDKLVATTFGKFVKKGEIMGKKKKLKISVKGLIKKLKSKETKEKIRKLRKGLKTAAKYVAALDSALGEAFGTGTTKKSGGFTIVQPDLERIFGSVPSAKKRKKLDISRVL